MKKAISMILVAMLLVSLIPAAFADTSLANGSQAIVVTQSGKLNMRSGASSSYSIVKRLSSGTTVTIVSRTGDWYYVTAGGTSGYVSASFLRSAGSLPSQSNPPTNNNPANSSQTPLGASATVTTNGGSLNMRSAADARSGVVRRLPNGASVVIQEKVGEWYRVSYNGAQGYVQAELLNG